MSSLDIAISAYENQMAQEDQADRLAQLSDTLRRYGYSPALHRLITAEPAAMKIIGSDDTIGAEAISATDGHILGCMIGQAIEDALGQEVYGWRERLHTHTGAVAGSLSGAVGGIYSGVWLARNIPYLKSIREAAHTSFVAGAGRAAGMGGAILFMAAKKAAAVAAGVWLTDKFLSVGQVYGSKAQVESVISQYEHIGELLIKLIHIPLPKEESEIDHYRDQVGEIAINLEQLGVPVTVEGKTPSKAGKNPHYNTPYQMVRVKLSGWDERSVIDTSHQFVEVVNKIHEELGTLLEKKEDPTDANRRSLRLRSLITMKAFRHLHLLVNDTNSVFTDLKRFFGKKQSLKAAPEIV